MQLERSLPVRRCVHGLAPSSPSVRKKNVYKVPPSDDQLGAEAKEGT